jgi:predicted transcriptional regulator
MKARLVVQDKIKLALSNDLAKGVQTIRTLMIKNRISHDVVIKALDSMEDEGLVIRVGQKYKLTLKGRTVLNEARKLEQMGAKGRG